LAARWSLLGLRATPSQAHAAIAEGVQAVLPAAPPPEPGVPGGPPPAVQV